MKKTAVEWYEKEINFLFEKYEAKEISERDFITMKHNLFYPAKEMENKQKLKALNVTRVEVIQHSDPHNGRAYVNSNAKDVFLKFQDDGRTLKIFLK